MNTPDIPPPTGVKPATAPPSNLPPPTLTGPPQPPVPTVDAPARINLKLTRPADTPQEAADECETGVSFNTRFLAAFIDSMLGLGVYLGFLLLLPGWIGGRLGGIAWLAYLITRDSLPFLGGQSIGKKAMGITVVTHPDGKNLVGNWRAGLIRNGVLLIPFFAFLEIYLLLTREETARQGLRLGDEWAATRIIPHRPETPQATTESPPPEI